MLVSIDPGTEAAGVAAWSSGTLRSAFLARGKTWEGTAQNIVDRLTEELLWPTQVVIEIPQTYVQSRSVGDPNVVLTPLVLQAGALLGSFGLRLSHRLVFPRDWKGQTPKPILIGRVKERLSESEHTRVEMPRRAKSLEHNVWDAIGIGLFHLGRTKGKRAHRHEEAEAYVKT